MSDDTLVGFRELTDEVVSEASLPFEWAEASPALDLDTRKGDPVRIARYLHQMCSLHAINYRRANFVKLAYLGRFYFTEVDAQNPLGITAAARAILEAHAFSRFIQGRLIKISASGHTKWKERGEEFFAQVVRARFATKEAGKIAALTSSKLSKAALTPYSVADCIGDTMRRYPEFSWMKDQYSMLCDYVHTNLSSQALSTVGIRQASALYHESGGAVHFGGDAPVAKHQYPSPLAFAYLLKETIERAFKEYRDTIAAINETPETPYSTAELIELTGDPLGVKMLSK
jgi:hypothetical protein